MANPSFESRLHILGRSCRLVIDDCDGAGGEMFAVARGELERIEKKFDSHEPESIISEINRGAGSGASTPLDAESRSLFSYVSVLWTESSHLFDPSSCLLKSCYSPEGHLLASNEQLRGMLRLVDWSGLEVNERGAHLSRRGMLIDLNSCIRPYAVDCVRKILMRNGVSKALIELDHDIASIGKQPDGANWLVGLRHPRGNRAAITRIKLNDSGYSIRGNFERRVSIDNEFFGRALSPVDGRPIPGLLSVAVMADNCLTACSAASIARLKTELTGLKWLAKLGLPWLAIDRQLQVHGPLSPG